MSPPARSRRAKSELSLVQTPNGRSAFDGGGKGFGRGVGAGLRITDPRGSGGGIGDWGGLPEGSWWYAGFFPPSVCRLLEGLSGVDDCKVRADGGVLAKCGCWP